MSSKNDITGDSIQSRGLTQEYSDGWDRIFGKNKTTPLPDEVEEKKSELDDTIDPLN